MATPYQFQQSRPVSVVWLIIQSLLWPLDAALNFLAFRLSELPNCVIRKHLWPVQLLRIQHFLKVSQSCCIIKGASQVMALCHLDVGFLPGTLAPGTLTCHSWQISAGQNPETADVHHSLFVSCLCMHNCQI